MNYSTYLIKLINTGICIGASYLALQTFMASSIMEQLFISLTELFNSQLNLYVDEAVVKAGFIFLILAYIIYNLYRGEAVNVMNIYYVDILLIIFEVFSHSKFQWLTIFFGLDVYKPAKSYTEILFIALLIIGGYIQLFFDSKFRETSLEFADRGIDDDEISKVYIKRSHVSLTVIVFSFFVIILVSFLISAMVDMLLPIPLLNNMNYIIFGIFTSLILSTTLYIFLKDQTKPQEQNTL